MGHILMRDIRIRDRELRGGVRVGCPFGARRLAP
jgi:hypothetical protein